MEMLKNKLLGRTLLGICFVLFGVGVLNAQNQTATNTTGVSSLLTKPPVEDVKVEVELVSVPLTRPDGSTVTLTPEVFAFYLYEFTPNGDYGSSPQQGNLERIVSSSGKYPDLMIKNKKLFHDQKKGVHVVQILPLTTFKTGVKFPETVYVSILTDRQLEYKDGHSSVTEFPITLDADIGRNRVPMVAAKVEVGFGPGGTTPRLVLKIKITPLKWIGE
ncbi:MAG: hypothetical protein COZ46_02860 [Verrucomicrobia bacterium CG_4_10_14_3_um_filter_43_23]|nr:MAG: hypothetical protein AUJ82_00925 [Verrucomicrobia bacterium CG1_02_43_26]PIP59460.1 MAG: hypothetical protein COX01_02485 [Verrucomicrobia bacterium CG22_combo_CG10-13_8_21_14_all_43_17]PIX58621.1 MAG: hypothetical protein COZ46_02860 [Verrucomicrobia bacterium CG_4_10_14_3_um_filter_43_23]PIY61446.1 MAG: hypothetical protein COY94_05225 [Verrucomicrobia bacterium CG_4_10_14_0_8_um_filter_43_34]PJA43813.1 MAG: hypothetical protein CO175_06145 [Verrucomicrobia bacterium CG_4_9_14_3_um_fi